MVILLLVPFQIRAQQYEWIRKVLSGASVNIVGSVTDSLGNFYTVANFGTRYPSPDSVSLWPDVENVVFTSFYAKFSPEGEMVWYKGIGNSSYDSEIYDIKPQGDTAFTCLVRIGLATCNNCLYYLDTLIPSTGCYSNAPWPDYPLSAQFSDHAECLALITFDFDGHVLEQHFLQMSYLDTLGMDIQSVYPPELGLHTDQPILSTCAVMTMLPSFAIDDEGNIYLSRWVNDYASVYPDIHYSTDSGTISAVRIWCDGREVGVVPSDSSLHHIPQIFKFSPHFDTLLASRYVFQSCKNNYSFYPSYLQLDDANGVYFISSIVSSRIYPEEYLAVDSTKGFYLKKASTTDWKGFLVKYDDTLSVVDFVSLDDSVVNPTSPCANTTFYCLEFDSVDNLLFLAVDAGLGPLRDTADYTTTLSCQGVPLSGLNNGGAFFISFNVYPDSLRFHSYGKVPAMHTSSFSRCGNRMDIDSKNNCMAFQNNRVFLQANFKGGVIMPDGNMELPGGWYDESRGITIFDYDGHVIGGVFYGDAYCVSSLVLKDSVLYFADQVSGETLFCDSLISSDARSTYIVKYVDTAFMHPYVYPGASDTTIWVEVVQEEMTVVNYPNPTSGRLTLVMNGRPLREAYVAAMDGVAQPLRVTPLGDGRYAADLSDHPDGAYTLVLISDKTHVYRTTVILQR